MEWTYWVFTLFQSTKYNRSYRHSSLFNGTEIHHEDKISWNAVLVSHSLSPFVTTKFSFVLHPLCSCSPSLSCNEVETPQISNILSLSLTFAFISQKLPISLLLLLLVVWPQIIFLSLAPKRITFLFSFLIITNTRTYTLFLSFIFISSSTNDIFLHFHNLFVSNLILRRNLWW